MSNGYPKMCAYCDIKIEIRDDHYSDVPLIGDLCNPCHKIWTSRAIFIWVVIKNPSDMDCNFVARKHDIELGVTRPTEIIIRSEFYRDIELVMIEKGLRRVPRADGDDPVIVETWL